MTKPIAIVAGEPNSISSEIIFKSWKLRKLYAHKPLIVIGSIKLLNLQGKIVTYSNKKNKKLFDLTVGGFGLTGIILSVKISLKKVFKNREIN